MPFCGGDFLTPDPASPSAHAEKGISPLRCLIVDDSPVIRLTLTQAPLRNGVDAEDISEAATFHEAVEEYDEGRRDVVFLDVSLPEGHPRRSGPGSFVDSLTGVAANDSVPKAVVHHMLETNAAVKIVVCTGNSPEDPRVRELLASGVRRLRRKPIDPAEIGEVVRQIGSRSS